MKKQKNWVVSEAESVIREEICSKLYSMEEYPATTNFMVGAENDVPETLSVLLEKIIIPGVRKSAIPSWKKTLNTIGLISIKKISSRLLIDMLAAIRLSCS